MSDNKFKSGFVAILGRPNVGKSTIMNHLVGMKIAAVSKRAQTTRKKIQTVYTDDRGQIIFLDTPGVNRAETKLGEYMMDAAVDSLKTADIIMWIVEPSTFIGTGERLIAEMIGKTVRSLRSKKEQDEDGAVNCPVILVVNKADTADDAHIEKTFETYNAYLEENEELSFDERIAVSATETTNLDQLMQRIYDMLPEGPMYYDEETITDETEREIAAEYIREKCLRNLDKEIPHGIAVIVDKMKTRPDNSLVDIDATIICEKESHKGIIIGKNGSMLKKIGIESRRDIESMLQMKVNLKLWVKVRPGWRDKTIYLDEYGYKS
ncbi:MAG TPA: GTPase Era [Lachnospiraceae bacterium]|nr:GTPase Era [Eubacterium sp.]HBZ03800.1 GTPase Era [Lachnospiraceae bacterium]